MDIKDIALRLRNENPQGIQTYDDYLVWFAEALVAEIQRQSEPVALFSGYYGGRPVITPLVTYILPTGSALFTFPPDKAQIEQSVAEACAQLYLDDYDLTDIAERVRSGEWKKFRKGE